MKTKEERIEGKRSEERKTNKIESLGIEQSSKGSSNRESGSESEFLVTLLYKFTVRVRPL